MDKVELRVVRQADGEVGRLWAAVFGVAGGTIGRGGQNKLVLPDTDAGVARVHAMVRMESEAAYIANLCERRSIFVAGEEVRSGEEVKLAVGDEVRIGPYTLYSVVPGAPFVAPVPAPSPSPSPSPVAAPADAPAPVPAQAGHPVAAPAPVPAAGGLPPAVPAVGDLPEGAAPAAHVPQPAVLFEAPAASPGQPVAGRPPQSPVETFPAAEDDDNPFAMLGRVESPASPAPVRAPQPAVAPAASGPGAMPVPTTGLSLLSGVAPTGIPEPALPSFAPAEALPPAVPPAAPAGAGALPMDPGAGVPGTPAQAASPWSVPVAPGAPGAPLGAPVPAASKPAAGPRALVIPEDFDLFAADPRRGEEKKDVWGGGLQGKSLSEIANLRHDELLQSLPASGTKFAHDMDNPSHAGLPKGLDPRSELDPLRLFGGASGPALHDPERGAVALGSDLSQSFSLPKGVPMPEGGHEAPAMKPPEGPAPLPPLPVPQAPALGGVAAGLAMASQPPSGAQMPAAEPSMAGPASAAASPAAPLEGLLRVEGLDLGAFGSEPAPADRLDWPMVGTGPVADAAGPAGEAEGDWPAAVPAPTAAAPLGAGQDAAFPPPDAQALPIGGLGLEGSGMLSGGSGLSGAWPSPSPSASAPSPVLPAPAVLQVDAPTPAPAPVPPPAATAREWPGQPATAARSPLAPMLPELEAASPAELQSLIAAFLEGAGVLSKKVEPQRLSPEFMRSFGEAFRVAVQGTIDLLAARSEIKREFRAGVTVISSGANNPLKFLPTSEGVVMQMIGQNFPGFMKPIPAMEEAYDDLRVHQVALMAGLRAAYAEALERFDPSVLEQRTDVTGGVFGMLSATSRKAALWDEYKRSFAEIRRGAEDDLAAFSGQAFLEAYENAEAAAKART